MKKVLSVLAVLLGLAFLFLAWVYWSTPANLLPAYLPGHDFNVLTVHFKHGFAAFIVAIGLFVFAWFESGKKK